MIKIILLLLFLTSCSGSEPSINTQVELKAIDVKISDMERMVEMVESQDITKEMIPINKKKLQNLEKRIEELKTRRAKLEGSN